VKDVVFCIVTGRCCGEFENFCDCGE